MCFPQCQAMQRCQLLNNEEKPKCVCPRPIPGQNGSHSCPAGQQPDARCKFVLWISWNIDSILIFLFRKCGKWRNSSSLPLFFSFLTNEINLSIRRKTSKWCISNFMTHKLSVTQSIIDGSSFFYPMMLYKQDLSQNVE